MEILNIMKDMDSVSIRVQIPDSNTNVFASMAEGEDFLEGIFDFGPADPNFKNVFVGEGYNEWLVTFNLGGSLRGDDLISWPGVLWDQVQEGKREGMVFKEGSINRGSSSIESWKSEDKFFENLYNMGTVLLIAQKFM